MKKIIGILVIMLSMFILSDYVDAVPLGAPTITSPSSGSSYDIGDTFTVSATVECGSNSGNCEGSEMEINLPSGLSTSSNPQYCGKIKKNKDCTKSWTVSANTAGSKSITATSDSDNAGGGTSSSITLTVNSAPIVCGDNVCQSSEDCSTCSQDCGSCPVTCPDGTCSSGESCRLDDSACSSGQVCTNGCQAESVTNTSDDGTVSDTSVSISVLAPLENQVLVPGRKVQVTASLGSSSDVRAVFGENTKSLFDDGERDDKISNNNIYGNLLEVPIRVNGTYQILVEIDESGKSGKEHIDVIINPELSVNFNISDTYFKGSDLIVDGTVTDANGIAVQNSNVILFIETPEHVSNITTIADENGKFSIKRSIGFVELEGKWKISVKATDEFRNNGLTESSFDVRFPSGVSDYSIDIGSPINGFTYKRGDLIPISINVLENGNPVEGVNVSGRSSKGNEIILKETSLGIYSGQYKIRIDDPYGRTPVDIIGFKEDGGIVKGGANGVILDIQPATINLELNKPLLTEFYSGQRIKISVKARYSDGSLVRNGIINGISQSGNEIILKEGDPGVYEGSYRIREDEEGSWIMAVEAKDIYQNVGVISQSAYISPPTLLNILKIFWYFTAIGISPFVFIGYLLGRGRYRNYRVKHLKNAIAENISSKKEIQIKYFKEGSINSETYKNLILERERELSKLKTKFIKAESKIKSKHNKNKSKANHKRKKK